MIESLILLVPALLALICFATWQTWRGKAGLLSLSGIITATPLLMFGTAVRRLRLSTMGFLQYVGPTLQFLMATVVFHEPLNRHKLISFVICWIAIAIYVSETALRLRTGDVETANSKLQTPNKLQIEKSQRLETD